MERMGPHRPRIRGRGAGDQWLVRARRWCVRRTERDARLATARGRPISEANLRRLRMRRWAEINRLYEHNQ
jgi:hypothetical protein